MQSLGSDSSPVQIKFTEADAMVLRKVLILCHHRFGSTLMVDLLRAHPHIMCLGELLNRDNVDVMPAAARAQRSENLIESLSFVLDVAAQEKNSCRCRWF